MRTRLIEAYVLLFGLRLPAYGSEWDALYEATGVLQKHMTDEEWEAARRLRDEKYFINGELSCCLDDTKSTNT